MYPECSRQNFQNSYFHEELRKNGFQLLSEEDCGFTTDSGNNLGFGFHVKGEKCTFFLIMEKGADNISGKKFFRYFY